jgi:hypothetical protein|tara:strand:+ start:1067 stop:1273 length:207 start_codon:yes stop_codon:yes gene_type:complete
VHRQHEFEGDEDPASDPTTTTMRSVVVVVVVVVVEVGRYPQRLNQIVWLLDIGVICERVLLVLKIDKS